jgi:hypothetical protein
MLRADRPADGDRCGRHPSAAPHELLTDRREHAPVTSAPPTIVVVEDDANIAGLVELYLRDAVERRPSSSSGLDRRSW